MKSKSGSNLRLSGLLGRLGGRSRRRPATSLECKREEVLFQKMEDVITASRLYCRKSLSVELLAKELTTNRTYVSRVLRHRGFTFSSYINGYRIQYAIVLLCNDSNASLSAEVIADMCGFMSERTLNYYIRKNFGISFSILRKRIRSAVMD